VACPNGSRRLRRPVPRTFPNPGVEVHVVHHQAAISPSRPPMSISSRKIAWRPTNGLSVVVMTGGDICGRAGNRGGK